MNPQDVARIVQIALAIEPIPNKEGLTTRFKDKEETLKLEYFIIGAINSGNAIRELMWRPKFTPSYDLLTKAVNENHLNRGGYRVNEGILISLWPILTTLRDYDSKSFYDLQKDLKNHLIDTDCMDAMYFQMANNFTLSQWEGHNKHLSLVDTEQDSLHSYLETKKDIYFYHEILNAYPIAEVAYFELNQQEPYSEELERLWKNLRGYIDDDKPSGQIADILAITIFLAMYFDGYKII